MIEIKRRNDYWELYLMGSLQHYSKDLQDVANFLARHAEEFEIEIQRNNF